MANTPHAHGRCIVATGSARQMPYRPSFDAADDLQLVGGIPLFVLAAFVALHLAAADKIERARPAAPSVTATLIMGD